MAVEDFLSRVDAYCADPRNDIAEIWKSFREYESECIKGLQERFYKRYPYNYNVKMARSMDVSARKIREICNKK